MHDPVKKHDPICEYGDAPNAEEWLEGESSGSENEESREALGYTFDISTRGAKKSHKNVSNKSFQCTKRSDGASSSRGNKSILPPIDENDDEVIASDKEFLASDDSETEESEDDIVLDDNSE